MTQAKASFHSKHFLPGVNIDAGRENPLIILKCLCIFLPVHYILIFRPEYRISCLQIILYTDTLSNCFFFNIMAAFGILHLVTPINKTAPAFRITSETKWDNTGISSIQYYPQVRYVGLGGFLLGHEDRYCRCRVLLVYIPPHRTYYGV